MPTKVAENNIERKICSNRHGVGTHQAARDIIGISKDRLDSGSIRIVNDSKHLLSELLR